MVIWVLGNWNIMDNSEYLLLWKCQFIWINFTILNIINWLQPIDNIKNSKIDPYKLTFP